MFFWNSLDFSMIQWMLAILFLVPLPFLNASSDAETGSKLGKEYIQTVYCHPACFNLFAGYTIRTSVLEEAQAGIKIAGRNINNLRYADETNLTAGSEEELLRAS